MIPTPKTRDVDDMIEKVTDDELRQLDTLLILLAKRHRVNPVITKMVAEIKTYRAQLTATRCADGGHTGIGAFTTCSTCGTAVQCRNIAPGERDCKRNNLQCEYPTCLVAALTPEPLGQEWVSKVTQDDGPELSVIGAPEPTPPSVPVTYVYSSPIELRLLTRTPPAPPSVPVLHIPPDIAKGSAVATPPTPAPKQEPTVRLSKTFDITSEKLPTLTGPPLSLTATLRESFSAPADDGRGLAVDMLDVDRLRNHEMCETHPMPWMCDLADRLATQITETLSLRQSLREAEQARDALRAALREAAAKFEQIYRYGLNAQGDLRFDVVARQAYDAKRLADAALTEAH